MASRPALSAPALTPGGVKLLFLDLDGVICCNYHGELEAGKLALVERIVQQTDCRVVLSTDWRRQPHLRKRAEDTLAEYGVTCIGATPEFPMYSRVRPKEILAWLADYRQPVSGWCAIDDRDLVLEEGGAPAFLHHFVLTEFNTGLTPQLADKVVTRLENETSQLLSPAQEAARNAARWQAQPWPPSSSQESATPASCRAEATAVPGAMLSRSGISHSASTPAQSEMRLKSVSALLRELSMPHLEPFLRRDSLRGLAHRLGDGTSGRIALLNHLRSVGVARLSERQAIANALGKAVRQDRVDLDHHAADEDDVFETGASTTPHSPPTGSHLRGSYYAQPSTRAVDRGDSSSVVRRTSPETPTSVLREAMSVGTLTALREALQECEDLVSPSLAEEARKMRDDLKRSVAARAAPPPERQVRIDQPDSGFHPIGGLLSVQPGSPCAALLCHPHPARGGDMYHAFIASVFVLLRDRGISTLRFNFSDLDEHDPDDHESLLAHNQMEAAAAIDFLREHTDDVPLVLIGFSWGSIVSLAVARDNPLSVQAMGLVSPPIDILPPALHPSRGDFARWPMLLATGDQDEYCDAQRLREIAGGSATTCILMEGVSHFLMGPTAQMAAEHVDGWVGTLDL